MSDSKKEVKKEKNKLDTGLHLYVESIKEGPISAMDRKSGARIDLFKGLNKVKKSVWESVKGLPMIKAYLEGGTLKESKVRCLDPEMKDYPKSMEKSIDDKKKSEKKVEPKAEEVEEIEEKKEEEIEEKIEEPSE